MRSDEAAACRASAIDPRRAEGYTEGGMAADCECEALEAERAGPAGGAADAGSAERSKAEAAIAEKEPAPPRRMPTRA